MCTVGCIMFGVKNLKPAEVRGRNTVEIGACEVNGSLRPILESYAPASYVGVDIAEGVGVDIVCDAERVLERLEKERFDIVISTEVIEHTRDWKRVISNMKNLCAPEGTILITTRSLGFHYHAYPHDFWRYETEDMREIFSDCEIVSLAKDPGEPRRIPEGPETGRLQGKGSRWIPAVQHGRRTQDRRDHRRRFPKRPFPAPDVEKGAEGTQEKDQASHPERVLAFDIPHPFPFAARSRR